MTLAERVRTLLASLGDTAKQVANALRKRGITGVKCRAGTCPIAQVVASEFPGVKIFVGLYAMTIGDEDISTSVPHTEATARFVAEFDKGRYSFLRRDQ